VIGSIFASLTVSKTIDAVRAVKIPASLQASAVSSIHARGAGFPLPRGIAASDAATLSHALANGLADATRPALFIAAGFVTFGAFLSLLLPRTPPVSASDHVPVVEVFDPVEPIEPDRALLDEREPA
jgi:hypothetical protein